MHTIATKYPKIKGGFIHIPYLPEQAANLVNQPSMELNTIIDGLEVIISTSLAFDMDLNDSGGAIC